MTMIYASFLFFILTAFADTSAIYGPDNRIDVYQSNDPLLRDLSYSTAAMIINSNLKSTSSGVTVEAPLLKQVYKLCSSERFKDQLTAANCSGTLIDKDIILTAGHCMTSKMDCSAYSWVFDYRATSGKQLSVQVPTSSVYKCQKVIAQKNDYKNNIDFALIKLDRKVTDRSSVNMRLSGSVTIGDKLALIGHPRGLPTKIAAGGLVQKLGNGFFQANLDAYSINSGSGVFNEITGELEGILISGRNDFEQDSSGCVRSSVYSDQEGAEFVTKVESIWNLIDQF
jgi:V8-like Glu-specific endopeptidase